MGDKFKLDQLAPVLSKGGTHWVDVTHVISPQNFFVRLCSSTNFLSSEMDLSGNIRPESLDLGDIIVYKSSETARRVRGKIIDIADDALGVGLVYGVFAIDYGFVERDVKDKDIWACNDAFSRIPPLAYNCELEFCYPIGDEWSKTSIEAFEFYVTGEKACIGIRDINDGKFLVQLMNTTEDISTIMALCNYSTYTAATNDVNRIRVPVASKKYYVQKKINVGDTLHVTVLRQDKQRSFDDFLVAERADFMNYKTKIKTTLNMYRNDAALKNLEVGMPVIADVDIIGCERALIKEISVPGLGALVELVDLGNTQKVWQSSLKEMPDALLTHPVIALRCRAIDVSTWLYSHWTTVLMPGYEFKITIEKLKTDTEPYIVRISPLK